MYSKADIIKKLSGEGQFIDNFILDAFIKNWHIDPIYEDEKGVEFFDDASYANIKSLITQRDRIDKNKTIKNTAEKIPASTNDICESSQPSKQTKEKQQIVEKIPEQTNTVDIANKENALKLNKYEIEIKSIDTLTKNIACKITKEFEKFLKESDFIDDLLKSSECKNDNKYLAQKIRKIVKENIALKEKIKELQSNKNQYVKVFGNFYIKK